MIHERAGLVQDTEQMPSLTLALDPPPHPRRVKCDRIPEVRWDYFGRPRGARPTVGPFEDLSRFDPSGGPSLVDLWPLDPKLAPSARSLRLQRPGPQLDEQEKAAGDKFLQSRRAG